MNDLVTIELRNALKEIEKIAKSGRRGDAEQMREALRTIRGSVKYALSTTQAKEESYGRY